MLGLLSIALPLAAQSTKAGDWPYYTADLKGTKYSPLDQINESNFNKLEVAWRFKTDKLGPWPEYKLEATPRLLSSRESSSTRFSLRALEGALSASWNASQKSPAWERSSGPPHSRGFLPVLQRK
jgi:quinoprotein glucose dehydrogenase